MPEEFKTRRRRRLTIVCRRCRIKKAKCDRNMPCSNCVKHNCPHECVFELEPIASEKSDNESLDSNIREAIDTQLTSRNIANLSDKLLVAQSASEPTKYYHLLTTSSSFVGLNPVLPDTDLMNIRMDILAMAKQVHSKTKRLKHFTHFKSSKLTRPLCVVELSQQEPGAKLYWRFNDRLAKLKLMTVQNFDADLRQRILDSAKSTFGPWYIDIPDDSEVTPQRVLEFKQLLSGYGESIGIAFNPNFVESAPFQASVKLLMPDRNSLFKYLDQFFAKIYPVYPIVDEFVIHDFIHLHLVFSFNGSELLDVIISGREDLTMLSIIFFMLRLSYLSYFTSIRALNTAIINLNLSLSGPPFSLKASPITLDAVDLADRLLDEGGRNQKTSLSILQASILKSVVRMHALESELPLYNLNTTCNNGQLVQMAHALTMERDPDITVDFTLNSRTAQLKRKIWYVLVQLDYTTSLTFLSPMNIDQNSYHVSLPKYSAGKSNIKNLELEKKVLELMKDIVEVLIATDPLLEMALNLNELHKAADLVQHLTQFETLLLNKLGSTRDYFNNEESQANSAISILKLRTQVTARLFVGNFYYFLHLFYKLQGQTELDFFFFRKIIGIIYGEMNIFCSELMLTTEFNFDNSFHLLMTPQILLYLHVCALVGLGLAISLHSSVFCMADASDVPEEQLATTKALAARNETFLLRKLKLCKLISERYFYGWKCTKSYAFGCRMLYQKNLYTSNLDAMVKATITWSVDQQRELLNSIPEEVPVRMFDASQVSQYCYYSVRSIDDADLSGQDLYKTIQTDNFWVLFQTVNTWDPYALNVMLAKKRNLVFCAKTFRYDAERDGNTDSSAPAEPDSEEITQGIEEPNYGAIPAGNGLHGASKPDVYVPKLSELILGPHNDLVDLNLISADWVIDDFMPFLNDL